MPKLEIIHILHWNFAFWLIFHRNVFLKSKLWTSIGSGSPEVDPDHWRHMASIDFNKLIYSMLHVSFNIRSIKSYIYTTLYSAPRCYTDVKHGLASIFYFNKNTWYSHCEIVLPTMWQSEERCDAWVPTFWLRFTLSPFFGLWNMTQEGDAS